ncbi:polyunsaturated fatty acid lipoxygenase ALOX15B-like [Pholidichthys leucotaenia]
MRHDPSAIWAHLNTVLPYLKALNSVATTLHVISDGPTTQYRSKKNFFFLSKIPFQIGFKRITWNFLEAGHGKGPADGIGAAVKRQPDSVVAKGIDLPNGRVLYEQLSKQPSSVKLMYVTEEEIKVMDSLLPVGVQAIRGTMQMHQSRPPSHRKLKGWLMLDLPLVPPTALSIRTGSRLIPQELLHHRPSLCHHRIIPLPREKIMDYEVTVFTGNQLYAWTMNYVYIKLVGEDGKSARTCLSGQFVVRGQSTMTVTCSNTLGKLVRIEVDKQRFLLQEDIWYPEKVVVETPEGITYTFPIYQWIEDDKVHYFMEGTASVLESDNQYDQRELEERRGEYQWDVYAEELPDCIRATVFSDLPRDVRFTLTKAGQFAFTAIAAKEQLSLAELGEVTENWKSIEEIKRVMTCHDSKFADYVAKHWTDDTFFGYQCLNGTNPILIRLCTALPENFPVDKDKVPLDGDATLAEEMKNGNIFLCDYKNMDGVPTITINGTQQYLMAPLVLLQKTSVDELVPVAIQLKQKPGPDNPIFYPSDSKYDWLLAKIYVRSADFNEFELNSHLLRTHLLAEVFTIALMRNLPMVHPLYKLLMPHTRFTIQINYLARQLLISPDGVFTKFAASGGPGVIEILRRSLASITYRSLCIPDDITDRGVRDVPNYFYKDDGLRLWRIINRFVQKILGYYYKTDALVTGDADLQRWIKSIFQHGFLKREESGIPQKFSTVAELVKFITMVIFTCSAQHSAVNTGQFDYCGFMPNCPSSLQLPPPTEKGTSNKKRMLNTLPAVNTTVNALAAIWLLSEQSATDHPLGQYPRDYFTEEFPLQAIKEFQGELIKLSAAIEVRNLGLELPYTYLDPKVIVNSVSV